MTSAEPRAPRGDAGDMRPGTAQSIFQRRWRKFTSLRRGYVAFLVVAGLYALSFVLPLLANSTALLVAYEGRYYTPMLRFYEASTFLRLALVYALRPRWNHLVPGLVDLGRSHGKPAITSTASAPPTPHANMPRPPAFGVWESVPIIMPPGKA